MQKFWEFSNDRAFMKGLSTALEAVGTADRCAEADRFFRILGLQIRVQNGGFMSYFESGDFDGVLQVLDDFRTIGASKSHAALEKAISLFPPDIDVSSSSDREACIDKWHEEEDETGRLPISIRIDEIGIEWDAAQEEIYSEYARDERASFRCLEEEPN